MIMASDFLGISTVIQKLLIGLVSGIYKLVGFCYQVFTVLAGINIFKESVQEFLYRDI